MLADEPGLAPAIGLLGVPALGAHLVGVSRVHDHDRDARQFGLVAEEGLQLREGPSGMPVSDPWLEPLSARGCRPGLPARCRARCLWPA